MKKIIIIVGVLRVAIHKNVVLSITATIDVMWYSSRLLTHTTVDYVNFMQEYTWIYKLNFTQCVCTGYIDSWTLSIVYRLPWYILLYNVLSPDYTLWYTL